jgi:hypothetical protein
VLDVFILDRRDSRFVPEVAGLGMTALTRDLLDRSHAGRDALARILERLAGTASRHPSSGAASARPGGSEPESDAMPSVDQGLDAATTPPVWGSVRERL